MSLHNIGGGAFVPVPKPTTEQDLTLLANLNGPHDLKIDEPQLRELCAEIRSTIIQTVAQTGGHLGSSLGVVELTVALHRLLDHRPTGWSGTPATRRTPTSC